MGREPGEDEDIIKAYNDAEKLNKKVDISSTKPTGNSIGTAKNASKKIV